MRLGAWYKDRPDAIAGVEQLVSEMLRARGRVLTTGIGKSGYVARRMAASSLASGCLRTLCMGLNGCMGILVQHALVTLYKAFPIVEILPSWLFCQKC